MKEDLNGRCLESKKRRPFCFSLVYIFLVLGTIFEIPSNLLSEKKNWNDAYHPSAPFDGRMRGYNERIKSFVEKRVPTAGLEDWISTWLERRLKSWRWNRGIRGANLLIQFRRNPLSLSLSRIHVPHVSPPLYFNYRQMACWCCQVFEFSLTAI